LNNYPGNNDSGFSHINTVLFDLDGTLLDSNDCIIDSWRYTVRSLTGRDITDEEVFQTFGEMLPESTRRIMPDVDTEYAMNFFRSYQREIFLDRIKLFDGTEEVLRALKAAGYKVALVTSRLKSSTERGLAHFGIDSLFDAVLTASDIDKFKPDPAPIFAILEMIGSRPEEAILIGDTASDIEAGRAAGVITVLVEWSQALPSDKQTEGPTPDFIIKELRDIPKLLGVKETIKGTRASS